MYGNVCAEIEEHVLKMVATRAGIRKLRNITTQIVLGTRIAGKYFL